MSISPSTFSFVSELVRERAAIVVGPGKEYLVESRLTPLAREAGFSDVGQLVSAVRERSDERLARGIVEAMTTNETSWFRDRLPFEALSEHVVPDLVRARATDRHLAVWSAACSSGQEAYSLAMTLADHPLLSAGWTFDVLATDVSEEMIGRTRAARYSQLEINRGLPAALLVRHFSRVGPEWEVCKPVRDTVRARRLNLARIEPAGIDPPPMDVVFLRNVLIYFDMPTKQAVLRRVRRVLRPGGYLFLGGAETTMGIDDTYERVLLGGRGGPDGGSVAYRPIGTAATGSGLWQVSRSGPEYGSANGSIPRVSSR